MKKILVAGAALMMVAGPMISAATAEVNLSGDARVRWIVKDSYDFGNTAQDTTNYFDSRIRVKFDAKAKGGAFAKARLRMADLRWDGQAGLGSGYDALASEDKDVWVDYGYVGVPVGPVAILGGVVAWDVTKFFQWDIRPTVAALNYKNDNVNIYGLYIVANDDDNANDNLEDNNNRLYGLYVKANINADWSVLGYGLYNDDQLEWNSDLSSRNGVDNSGFLGTVNVTGKAAGLGIVGEIAYKNSDVQGTANDGWGAYGEVSYQLGGMNLAGSVGVTTDSFTADNDFGWLMIGDIEPMGVITNVGGMGQDWWWGAFTPSFAVSENLTLTGNLVYVNVDSNDDTIANVDRLADLWELSGKAVYTVSEGAELMAGIGYLQPSYDGRADAAGVQDDGAFGGMLQMVIKY